MSKQQNKNLFWKISITLLRISAAFLIILNPFWGLVISWILDYLDAPIMQYLAHTTWSTYQKWDKAVDWFMYLAMLIVVVRVGVFWILFPFIIYRLIGQIIYMFYGKEKVLIFFPNFFEALFIWFVILQQSDFSFHFLLITLLIFEIIREIFLHSFWPNYLKKHGMPTIFRIFGITKRINW